MGTERNKSHGELIKNLAVKVGEIQYRWIDILAGDLASGTKKKRKKKHIELLDRSMDTM